MCKYVFLFRISVFFSFLHNACRCIFVYLSADEVSPRENDKEQDELIAAPAVAENTDSNAEDGKQNANGETDKLENTDEQQEKGEAGIEK